MVVWMTALALAATGPGSETGTRTGDTGGPVSGFTGETGAGGATGGTGATTPGTTAPTTDTDPPPTGVTTPPTDTGGGSGESDSGAPTDTDTDIDTALGDTGPAFCYDCQSAAEVVGEPGGSPCSTSSGVAVGWAAALVALAARRRQSPSQR